MRLRLPEWVDQWDRGADAGEDVILYGWVFRGDGQRDFVVVSFNKETGENTQYITSSAKYSEALAAFYDDLDGHSPCLPFDEAIALLEAPR